MGHTDQIESLHITDFGVSRLFDTDQTLMASTHGVGSLVYMPPEVAEQIGESDAKYDPFLADGKKSFNFI